MNELPIKDLIESLKFDDSTIKSTSNCCCEFRWSFDPETCELICDIDHQLCYQMNTLISHGQMIMQNTLDTNGISKDVYFYPKILRNEIPDELYRKVHMENLDQVRQKCSIKHDERFRESLLKWLRTCGMYINFVKGKAVFCKMHKPAITPESTKMINWVCDVAPIILGGGSIEDKTLFLDFAQFDEKFVILKEDYGFYKLDDGSTSVFSEPYSSKEDAYHTLTYCKQLGMGIEGWYFTVCRNLADGYVVHGQKPDTKNDCSFLSLQEVYDYLLAHQGE